MAPSPSTVLCHYRYDPLDRLASTQPVAQDNALRFYRKNRLATQIQGAIRHTFFGHDDQLLAQQQGSGKSTETSLLATDQQGSVLHGVDGTGIESRAYNAYGHHPAESGLSCLMGFNGEQRDPVIGHYLLGNGYRSFNPVLMRFNSPDELSPFGRGGLNAYAYCQGDPVNFRDSTGRMPLPKALSKMWDDVLATVSSSVPVSDEMDTFIQRVVSPQNATVSRPVSASVAQASTSAQAMQAVPSTSGSTASDHMAMLQNITPKTMDARELSTARNRIKKLRRRGAFTGRSPKRLADLERRIRALERSKKDIENVVAHYRDVDRMGGGTSQVISPYMDYYASIPEAISKLRGKI